MKIVVCDCCGNKDAQNKFEYLCHLDEIALYGFASYIDRSGDFVSGRMESYDLCNKCYNEIMIKSVLCFREKRGDII